MGPRGFWLAPSRFQVIKPHRFKPFFCLCVYDHDETIYFRCLQIDSSAWHGIEEIAASSPAKHHIGSV